MESIRASGARIALVYLPTAEEIKAQTVYTFDDNESAVLRFYEDRLGVAAIYPADFSQFEGITEFSVSPVDTHPSVELQQAYGRYLASVFSDLLQQP